MQNEESRFIIANHWQMVNNVITNVLSVPNHGFLIAKSSLPHRMVDAPAYLQLQSTMVDVEIRNLFNGENNLAHVALPPHTHEFVSLDGPYGHTSIESKTADFNQACIIMRRMITASSFDDALWVVQYNPATEEWRTIRKYMLQPIKDAITVSQWPFA